MGDSEFARFEWTHHVAFFDAMATELPGDYASQEVNHLTLAYFAVGGLSLLRELERVNKDEIAKWVLSFQVHPEANDDVGNGQFFGFCGSRSTQFPLDNVKDPCFNGSHLASTYSALAILKIVGYDLASIDSKALLSSIRKLQQLDGRYAFSIGLPHHSALWLALCVVATCFIGCISVLCGNLNHDLLLKQTLH
ncbi:hypothetical protein PR202_ga23472 [Eleusine coracana subsp. coracana]|uniref:Prenyltransferase alpha-alpha toroid domain-containing protein n=1 Tax=Eleusine coracana subsp. coracana TaxID=191504 RepID=A0AAV5D5A8_ELECO|nr:hypothetical protein PR202_ga23472 [Eleusine coracana subsp. coracana]